MHKKIVVSLLIVASLAVGFTGGAFYSKSGSSIELPSILGGLINRDVNKPEDVDFSEFWTVWDMLHENYVDKDKISNNTDLLYGSIDGLVNSIGDPYTVFLKPVASKNFLQQIDGSFGGIGIEIGLRNDILTVIAPIKDTPAAKAGLLAGDKITKIGDKSTAGIKVEEAVELIRGPKGTKIKLTYVRGAAKSGTEVTITRGEIKIPAIDLKIDGKIAYIQFSIFNKNADFEFDKAAKEISKSGADRIILDLRNNPGGLLDSAVNITSYFLDTDKIVTIERFGNGKEQIYKTRPNGILKDYPLIILINEGSASASEILAGAIKDNRGITLIGKKSFGKGSVQEIRNLSDGASLKITIAKWFTPKDMSISDHGIMPDIEVELTEDDFKAEKDPQLDKAKELIQNLK